MAENNAQGIQFKDSENVFLLPKNEDLSAERKKENQGRTKQFWFNKEGNPRIVIGPHCKHFS
jgi:hypothetical protein